MVTASTVNPKIIQQLAQTRLFAEGHFAYRTGQHSRVKFNRDLLLVDPDSASSMGYALAKAFFTSKVDTVACPSIWGAGLAQWVAWFLEPRAMVVTASRATGGSLSIAPDLHELLADRRVLLIDNLSFSGDTLQQFGPLVRSMGGEIVGGGCLWSMHPSLDESYPFVPLLNDAFPVWEPDACPICAEGDIEVVPVAW